MNASSHLSFSVYLVPGEERGAWRGEVVHQQSGRSTAITSVWGLARRVTEEADLHAPRDDSQWTQLISEASRQTRTEFSELSKAS
ncbi:MAG: hypothetical protein M3Z66_01950 [Chloroflexota bacterium]|nr:hypothetical protein [Chloroflexota bacterium]